MSQKLKSYLRVGGKQCSDQYKTEKVAGHTDAKFGCAAASSISVCLEDAAPVAETTRHNRRHSTRCCRKRQSGLQQQTQAFEKQAFLAVLYRSVTLFMISDRRRGRAPTDQLAETLGDSR